MGLITIPESQGQLQGGLSVHVADPAALDRVTSIHQLSGSLGRIHSFFDIQKQGARCLVLPSCSTSQQVWLSFSTDPETDHIVSFLQLGSLKDVPH